MIKILFQEEINTVLTDVIYSVNTVLSYTIVLSYNKY